jgi:cytochrome P450
MPNAIENPAEETTPLALFGGTETSPVVDPYSVYRRLRAEQPVIPMRTHFGRTWLVSRYDDVREGLRNDALFSNRANARGIGIVMGRTIVEMDGREHLRHRSIVTPALAPRALRGDFPRTVEALAHERIDAFAGRGTADLVEEFTFTYPLQVFARILGLPDQDFGTLHRRAIDLTSIGQDPARGFEAAAWLADYLSPLLAKRRATPTGDLVSRLAHAEVEGERLTDEEVVSFLRLLVIAGAETTYHLMGSALFALLTHPETLAAVLRDPDRIESLLEETLRWEAPVQIVNREAVAPVEIAGTEIPAGESVTLAVGSANRDETRFPDPDRFQLDRACDVEHLAFGFGKHYCAGSRLALLEASIGLRALLERLPELELEPGEPSCAVVGLAFRGPNRLPVRFRPTPIRVAT